MQSIVEYKEHEFCGLKIRQRIADGYISASDMCKAGKKEWSHYKENKRYKELIEEFERVLDLPRAQLVQSITANIPSRGTWVHPDIAINLAQWISAPIAVKVSGIVRRFYEGDLSLVKDVVERHDQVNNTESTVVINSVDKTLEQKERTLSFFKSAADLLKDIDCFDDRAYLLIQSEVLNLISDSSPSAAQLREEEYSVSRRVQEKYNKTLSSKNGKKILIAIGKEMAKQYRELYSHDPPQREQFVDGTARLINHYTVKDWIEFGDAILTRFESKIAPDKS